MRLFITAEELADQRAKGWSDIHPEMFCHRCFSRNIWSWSTSNELWAAAELDEGEIVCPQCFTEAHFAAMGKDVTWRIVIDEEGS